MWSARLTSGPRNWNPKLDAEPLGVRMSEARFDRDRRDRGAFAGSVAIVAPLHGSSGPPNICVPSDQLLPAMVNTNRDRYWIIGDCQLLILHHQSLTISTIQHQNPLPYLVYIKYPNPTKNQQFSKFSFQLQHLPFSSQLLRLLPVLVSLQVGHTRSVSCSPPGDAQARRSNGTKRHPRLVAVFFPCVLFERSWC